MARIRSIKPEFWTSEQIMNLPVHARLAFIGLWTFCDDGGNHPATARTLKAEVFPGDDMTTDDVQMMVDSMIAQGLVRMYQANGRQFWHVTGWARHQRIDKPTVKHPAPTELAEGSASRSQPFGEASSNATRGLTPGVEWSGVEGKLIQPATAGSPIEPDPDLVLSPSSSNEPRQKLPDCPYGAILELWRSHLPHLVQPRVWEGNRKTTMRQRWQQAAKPSDYNPVGYKTEADGIAFWGTFFEYIATETSLAEGFESNGRTWRPDLEWVCTAKNFQKIVDGKYSRTDSRSSSAMRPSSGGFARAAGSAAPGHTSPAPAPAPAPAPEQDPVLARMDAEAAAWRPPSPEVKAMLAETSARLKVVAT